MNLHRVIVICCRGGSDCNARIAGVERFLASEPGWETYFFVRRLHTESEVSVLRQALDKRVDGVLVDLSAPHEVLDAIARMKCPVVTMDIRNHAICDCRPNSRSVYCNDELIADTAVTHFINQGRFHSFAFVTKIMPMPYEEIRRLAYAKQLAAMGHQCHEFQLNTDGSDRPAFASWLRRLPKPAALMASNDVLASHVLQRIRETRMCVPNTIAVLGVDDDNLVCKYAVPSLSSIVPDFESEGFQSARLLNDLMHGKASVLPVRIPVCTITIRESTMPLSPAGILVRRAMHFIERNACCGIGPGDVARHLKVSRRLLYLRLKEVGELSPYAAIRERKLEEDKKRLVATSEKIAKIASDCGFDSETHLMHLFKRRFGATPGMFRNRHRRLNSPA